MEIYVIDFYIRILEMHKLTILSWNTLFAGRDGKEGHRAAQQIQQINALNPDVFLMQEAKDFEENGFKSLFSLEQNIGMRGFMSVAPETGQNLIIFIRDPLVPVRFESNSSGFHHTLATLEVRLPGLEKNITFINTHMCPVSAAYRYREAAILALQSDGEKLTLIAGDFNSASPHDPEPNDWNSLPPQHQARYLSGNLKNIDQHVLAMLEKSGWTDIGHKLDPLKTPTVPTLNYLSSEFPTMRCDYFLASTALASGAAHYQVIRNDCTGGASDHYPILATFEV